MKIVEKIPGPEHLEAISQINHHEQGETLQKFVNFKKSKGNFFVDSDGNTVLDLNAAAAG